MACLETHPCWQEDASALDRHQQAHETHERQSLYIVRAVIKRQASQFTRLRTDRCIDELYLNTGFNWQAQRLSKQHALAEGADQVNEHLTV